MGGALITSELCEARSQSLKFVPVFLSAPDEARIPAPLRSTSHYALTTEAAYHRLYDFLLGQAGVEPGPVGTPKRKPRDKGSPLVFTPSPAPAPVVDISRNIKYTPSELVRREAETQRLSDVRAAVVRGEKQRPHVLTFVALGGEGKASLVAKWVAALAATDWPGCDAAFPWSFYGQGTHEQCAASSDLFLKEALTFFGDPAMAGSSQGASLGTRASRPCSRISPPTAMACAWLPRATPSPTCAPSGRPLPRSTSLRA